MKKPDFRRLRLLCHLQLINLFGLNVLRHTRDKRERRKKQWLMAAYILVALVLAAYMGMYSFGLIQLGMQDAVIQFLFMTASLLIFFFSALKTGSVLFERKSADLLGALPLQQSELVLSRFVRMYVENLLLSLIVVLPGTAVYALCLKPEISFYLSGLILIVQLPLLPLTLAVWLGAAVAALTSHMKHKNLISAVLTVVLVLALMAGFSQLARFGGTDMNGILTQLSLVITEWIQKLYPPAVWMGKAMTESRFAPAALCMIGSAALLAGAVWFASAHYRRIAELVHSTGKSGQYRLREMHRSTVLRALYRREVKRYFASGIYVTNTIIGPVLSVAAAAAVLAAGVDTLQNALPIALNVRCALPFVVAVPACMMTTTSVSVSMEGAQWWLVKSWPVAPKVILQSKLLLNLSLIAPFYAVMEILLIIAMRPGLQELFWLLLIPAEMILFVCVLGLTVNLKLPLLGWENEVAVVKQSASALTGGLGGALIVLLCGAAAALVTAVPVWLTRLAICMVIGAATAALQHWNARADFKTIN